MAGAVVNLTVVLLIPATSPSRKTLCINMNRQEQIEYCSKCIHKSFDQKKGMVCGLTSLVPIIEVACPEISIDPKFEKLEAWKKNIEKKS